MKRREIHQEKNTLDANEFREKYLELGVPVIIRGCITDLPFFQWDMRYIHGKCGENIVQTRKNVHRDSYKIGLKYCIEELTIKDYINMLENDPERAKNYYLAVQNIKTSLPELEKEAILPKYIEKKHMGPYLWIGSETHYEFCHWDADDGFLMMIKGKKSVKLFRDLRSLYPNKLGSLGRTVQSQVDCDVFDLEKFPRLKDTVCEEGVLEEGDALFIPAFYWHQITSLTQSISMNCFFGDAGTTNFVTKVMSHRFDSVRYWILNIIEQNIEHESFHATYNQLDLALSLFLRKQWHETISKEQLDRLVTEVHNYLQERGFKPKTVETISKNPKLRIRGLLFRNEDPLDKEELH
jgi:ribosomal protein L16 Arg81 hydroxylase